MGDASMMYSMFLRSSSTCFQYIKFTILVHDGLFNSLHRDLKSIVYYSQIHSLHGVLLIILLDFTTLRAFMIPLLLHERFGHLNYWYLQQLHTHDMVIRLPKVSCTDGVYLGCALRKHHQDPFPSGRSHHASTPLELVHSDLMNFPHGSFTGA